MQNDLGVKRSAIEFAEVYGRDLNVRLRLLLQRIAEQDANEYGERKLFISDLMRLSRLREAQVWDGLATLRDEGLIEYGRDTTFLTQTALDIRLLDYPDWLEQQRGAA